MKSNSNMTNHSLCLKFGPWEEDKRVLQEEKTVLQAEKVTLMEEKVAVEMKMHTAIAQKEKAERELEDPLAKVGY